MKKRVISLLLVFVMVTAMVPHMAIEARAATLTYPLGMVDCLYIYKEYMGHELDLTDPDLETGVDGRRHDSPDWHFYAEWYEEGEDTPYYYYYVYLNTGECFIGVPSGASNYFQAEDYYPSYPAIFQSGTCGENLTWVLDTQGTLTISGTGPMYDYDYDYAEDGYASTTPWAKYRDLVNSIIIDDGVTSISSFAFDNCNDAFSVAIPDSVTAIGVGAFEGCLNLRSLYIPQNVVTIGEIAFAGCGSLSDITVSEQNPYFYTDAFGVLFCRSTSTLLRAPTDLSGHYSIPEGTKYISATAFFDLREVISVDIPSSVGIIGSSAFAYCPNLTSVSISNGVTTIASGAFMHCYDLTNLTIPDSVTSIGSDGFLHCNSLTDVYYSGTKAQWNAIDIGTGNECLTNALIHVEDPGGPQYNSLWLEEHLRYASSEEYESQIVPGYTGKLDNVFSDIMDDTGIKAYNLLDAVSSFLSAEGKADESDLYQLILADILYSRTTENVISEIYANNLQKNAIKLLEYLANSEEVISAFADSDNYQDLLDALDILRKVDIGSGDYSKAYTSFMNTFKGNVSLNELKSSLSKNATLTVLGIGLDLLFTEMKSIEDITQYIINCMAYESTSEEFKMVMRALANKADTMTGDAYFPRLRDYDGEIDWEVMRDAINEFVDALDAYEQKGMEAIAEEAVKINQEADVAFTKSAVKKVAVLAFDSLVGCVPVLNICNVGVKAAVSGGKLLIDLLTDVDDCAYAMEMMVRIYCFSVLMDSVADDYAGQLTDDNFTVASLFDESVSVYRSVVYHGSEYGMTYIEAKLNDALIRYRNTLDLIGHGPYREIYLKDVEGYTNSMETLKEQQTDILSIHCHNPYLDYSPEAEPIDYCITDSKLYLVACPVTMIVRSDAYGEIAILSDTESVIPEGLEHYFRVIETEPGSGEFMKVAIVPEGYEVILQGTGNGTMDAAVIEYHDGELEDPEFFLDIPVTEQSEGYFDEESKDTEDDELIFDDIAHEGESSGCPFTDVPADSFYYTPVLWALENGITNGISASEFGPSAACNRAQAVTFLWRAAGSPEPTAEEHPFVDVAKGSFYEKAVLWAVEKGITNGTDAAHFSPNLSCNRAAIVTFLYRAFHSPAVSGAENPFTDVPAESWYTAAVLWAVEKGITNGMGGGIFGVGGSCNRAQMVTFLHRAYTG